MESNRVAVHVDPTCPFAWITRCWLAEVEHRTRNPIGLELMSLSAVNEGRDLDDWYRDYNDKAWRPARVAAALLASDGRDRWPEFYERFGRRRHVEGLREDTENLRTTLAELQLPPSLIEAADDPSWDDDLRARTRRACDPLGGDGGTPVLHVHGRAFFGPVLTAVPRGTEATALWEATLTLARTAAFSEIKGARDDDDLRTE